MNKLKPHKFRFCIRSIRSIPFGIVALFLFSAFLVAYVHAKKISNYLFLSVGIYLLLISFFIALYFLVLQFVIAYFDWKYCEYSLNESGIHIKRRIIVKSDNFIKYSDIKSIKIYWEKKNLGHIIIGNLSVSIAEVKSCSYLPFTKIGSKDVEILWYLQDAKEVLETIRKRIERSQKSCG